MYLAYKHLHMTFALLSIMFFLFRYALHLANSGLLQKKFFKIAPHVIDTLMLISAVLLMVTLKQYPFVTPWLTEKLFAVVAYILLGVMAFKGRTATIRWVCFLGALGWVGLIVRLAMTKLPVFLPVV